ncbi:MAG: UUP1 family membrane protein, partial [Nevskiales bacterium]
NYGLATEMEGGNRIARWAVRRARGRQILYYRAVLYQDGDSNGTMAGPPPKFPEKPDYPEPYRSAVYSFLEEVRDESADIESFTQQLVTRLNAKEPDENAAVLVEGMDTPDQKVANIVNILAGAHIPARVVYGLKLQDGMRHGNLEPWLQVHNERRWLTFNPLTGTTGLPDDVVMWRTGTGPQARLMGGQALSVEFSVARNLRELVDISRQRAELKGSRIMDFSLYSLPIQAQNVYRVLLTIPLGALVVVFMRTFVGIKTFGTFMPILIALAFRETEWLWGMLLFTLIVALGLGLRFYLEQLKLLLVPRLSSVLIIVVLLMAGMSVVGHQLGLELGLSVALFPMVILAMTIERMSLVWEESGAGEALKQGLGSLLVASIGYAVMSNDTLTYQIFVFPELLLVMLALCLLAGRYTGYRLLEYWRFRALAHEQAAAAKKQ